MTAVGTRKLLASLTAFFAIFGGGNVFFSQVVTMVDKYRRLPLELQDLVTIVGILFIIVIALVFAILAYTTPDEKKD